MFRKVLWTFLTASVREASEAPRNFPRAGETGTDFRIPFLGAAAVAGEVDEVELFAAAIRTRQASPKIRVDGAIFPILSKNPREREASKREWNASVAGNGKVVFGNKAIKIEEFSNKYVCLGKFQYIAARSPLKDGE
nr:hypothetical protein Iba_chr13aCG4580 [Ipomoea batatas]